MLDTDEVKRWLTEVTEAVEKIRLINDQAHTAVATAEGRDKDFYDEVDSVSFSALNDLEELHEFLDDEVGE